VSGENVIESLAADAHSTAATAFIDRAQSRHREQLIELYLFGSTVRGEACGRASDVDILVVLNESDRSTLSDSLHEIALDVMIEYGPAIELHILSEAAFERCKREQSPFVRNVLAEGRSYV
jgi:uncharacterized protein